ncbi:histone acetyltransferase subunit NuA4 [Calycina marina]|uniref:Chromatin modification-related protein EAF6 n=1 Tax=Calycina marina TaxID=1763456 RepID=A0A9P7YXX7_9HELO|nr:histone acetyltransferase subunit NuA4 [Calycina marina]
MAENTAAPAADQPGVAFYEKQRRELAAALRQRDVLLAKIAANDDRIYDKETAYLDDTPNGNIMMGFDNYTKGTGAGGALRRRGGVDQYRVFSNSSVSFKQNAESPVHSAQGTPAHTAQTPIATNHIKGESGSGNATPTSTTSGNRMAAAAGSKRSKKTAGEDSGTDTKESKKARTGSTAVTRK